MTSSNLGNIFPEVWKLAQMYPLQLLKKVIWVAYIVYAYTWFDKRNLNVAII